MRRLASNSPRWARTTSRHQCPNQLPSSSALLWPCRARRLGLEAPPPDPRLFALTAFQPYLQPRTGSRASPRDPARCARRCAFRQSPPGTLMHLQARTPHIGSRAVPRIYAHSGISQSGLTCQRSLVQVQYRPPNNSRTSAAPSAIRSRFGGSVVARLRGPGLTSGWPRDVVHRHDGSHGEPAQPEPSSASHQSRTDSVVSVY